MFSNTLTRWIALFAGALALFAVHADRARSSGP